RRDRQLFLPSLVTPSALLVMLNVSGIWPQFCRSAHACSACGQALRKSGAEGAVGEAVRALVQQLRHVGAVLADQVPPALDLVEADVPQLLYVPFRSA